MLIGNAISKESTKELVLLGNLLRDASYDELDPNCHHHECVYFIPRACLYKLFDKGDLIVEGK